jgi:hypothetical protein
MIQTVCTKTARKIRRLGYPQKAAVWYAGFFIFSMLAVCTLMGVLSVPPEPIAEPITGSGKLPGARAGTIPPVFSSIR